MKKRIAKQALEFKEEGDFASLYKAQMWCLDHGYSYGSLCRDLPVALMKGEFNIAKWKNLTKKEQSTVDGVMLSDDFREGKVEILIF